MAERRLITIRVESSKDSPVYHDIQTDLDPQVAETLIVDTYKRWVEFALGRRSIGGRKLKHPTGAYAASIKLVKRSKDFYEMFSTSSIADMIESGRRKFNLKNRMLSHGTLLRGEPRMLPLKGNARGLPFVPSRQQSPIQQASSRSWKPTINRAEINERKREKYDKANFVWISDKSKGWNIPEMPAYHPADFLSKQLTERLTKAERGT